MVYLGLLGFILYFLYDLNQITIKSKLLKPTFTVGSLCLTIAWFSVFFSKKVIIFNYFLQIIFLLLAIISLILLVYTLFFAIPFKETYVEEEFNKVVKTGIYGFSRHPGVIFFFGFTIFASLAAGNLQLLQDSLIYNVFNLMYVIYQDIYIFPKCFIDYNQYKKEVHFLLPRIWKINGGSNEI